MNDILTILNPAIISSILIYLVPGLLFLKIFNFICTKEQKLEHVVIYSVAISFIMVKLVFFVFSFFKVDNITEFKMSLIIIFFSSALSVLGSLFYRSNTFRKILLKTFHKTANKTIWMDTLDLKNGTPVTLYLKKEMMVYLGIVSIMEENGEDSWINLSGYICIIDGKVVLNNENNRYEAVMLRLKDIDRIEISYHKDSLLPKQDFKNTIKASDKNKEIVGKKQSRKIDSNF